MTTLLVLLLLLFFPIARYLCARQTQHQLQRALLNLEGELGQRAAELQQQIAGLETQLARELPQHQEQISAEIQQQRTEQLQALSAELQRLQEEGTAQLGADLNQQRAQAESEIAAHKADALKEIDRWTAEESARLTQRLEEEYYRQVEDIQRKLAD
jgi:hypothetical protein